MKRDVVSEVRGASGRVGYEWLISEVRGSGQSQSRQYNKQ